MKTKRTCTALWRTTGNIKPQIALLLIGAMLLGILPLTGHSVSRASGNGIGNPRTTDGVTTWDCVWFGNYWQGDTNGDGRADKSDNKQPIKWRVLSVDGDDAFLLADKNLDCQKYNDIHTDVAWETCTMRSWLNGYGASVNVCEKDYTSNNFMDNAFIPEEQAAIKTTTIVNEDNPDSGTEGGNNTQDKIYLLALGEVTNPVYGFITSLSEQAESRGALNTDYAKAQGAETGSSAVYAENGDWWLRSPGINSSIASIVNVYGNVNGNGYDVNNNHGAVRPVLHLDLSSASSWSYAGTVSSEGVADEQAPPAPSGGESPKPGNENANTVDPSASPALMIGNPRTTDGVTTWDCVWFGNYWQDDTNGDGKADKNDAKQPIKWRVLSIDGDDAFLVADKNLDCQTYHDAYSSVTWETCTLRSWLNGYEASANVLGTDYTENNFIDNAFTSGEQSAIGTTTVVNEDNPDSGTESGNTTLDRVYLMSCGEMMNPVYGFASDTDNTDTRKALNTKYVAAGGEIKSSYMNGAGSANFWWLRSPGLNGSGYASSVGHYGNVDKSGINVYNTSVAVRPVLHLDLSSASSWSYAGTVSSDGVTDEQAPPAPAESPKPTVLPTAAATTKPEASPEVSRKPIVSSTPTAAATTEPEVSPEVSRTPILSSTPTPTVVATTKPEASPTPIVSSTPTAVPTTEPEASPEVSRMPMVSSTPTAAATTEPEASPEVSPTPMVSSKPILVPTLKPTVSSTVSPVPIGPPKPTVVPTTKPTASPEVSPAPTGTSTPTVPPATTVIPTSKQTASPEVSPAPTGSPKPTAALTEKPTSKPTVSPAASKPPVAAGRPAGPSTALPSMTPVATISVEKQQDGDTETGNSVSSPGKPVIKSVKNKKGKKIKITLKKEVEDAAGYQIQYARNKKFTKAKKSKDVGRWTAAKTIAGLKKGKTYYVRVRAYQKQSGKKVYGKWSRAKKVKIKK